MTLVSANGGNAITRANNGKQRETKEKKILDAARAVFCRKGFTAVTMQDIIDECGISRGGIYLYFASIDEIFLEVMNRRNSERFSLVNTAVQNNEPFWDVLSDYFTRQKKRLLNFENSLFRAYCEYIFSISKPAVTAFRDAQLEYLRKTITSILMLGVNQGAIKDENILQTADHFIVTIDGLSVLALGEVISEEIIDSQMKILEGLILCL